MPWTEFSTLLAGLDGETPLGRIVTIRSETDADRLKTFTADQHRIRSEYRSKRAKRMVQVDPDTARMQINDFQAAMKAAFYIPK